MMLQTDDSVIRVSLMIPSNNMVMEGYGDEREI